jgi:hypothetical protein
MQRRLAFLVVAVVAISLTQKPKYFPSYIKEIKNEKDLIYIIRETDYLSSVLFYKEVEDCWNETWCDNY